jgi:L-amino acid N-acyltransferase YncA
MSTATIAEHDAGTTCTLTDGRTVALRRRERCDPHELVVEAVDSSGQVVGDAIAEFEPSPVAGHTSVTVTPAWQGVGLGRSLLERLVAEAAPHGLRFLVARYPEGSLAVQRMVAGADVVVARRVGDGMVRVAVAVPTPVPDAG